MRKVPQGGLGRELLKGGRVRSLASELSEPSERRRQGGFGKYLMNQEKVANLLRKSLATFSEKISYFWEED